MDDRPMNDIEAEVDRIRQGIWAKIKDMTPEEKAAYYRARAEAARREFGIKISPLRPVPPVPIEYRRAREADSVS